VQHLEPLRDWDEKTFIDLVRAWHRPMLHVAMAHTPSRAVAEEVVQETWLAVLEGIDRFEQRSSLKTWVFRILMNQAITKGVRERRTVPFSSLASAEASGDEPSVDPDRFIPGNAERAANHWKPAPLRPAPWPEEAVASRRDASAPAGGNRPVAAGSTCRHHPSRRRGLARGRGLRAPGRVGGQSARLVARARSKVRTSLASHLEVQQ